LLRLADVKETDMIRIAKLAEEELTSEGHLVKIVPHDNGFEIVYL
jgi:hypothetical protein